MMLYLGIDPGVGGALVLIDGAARYVASLNRHGGVPVLIADFLRPHAGDVILAVVEKAGFMPHNGAKSHRLAGKGEGMIQGILAALQVPLREVGSSSWQAACGVVRPAKLERAKAAGADDPKLHLQAIAAHRAASKQATMRQALQRWPTLPIKAKLDWDLADAAFLAEYARLVHMGELKAASAC